MTTASKVIANVHEAAASAALAKYLAEYPAMTARDWPGNGLAPFDPSLSAPGARPWHELDASRVRDAATSTPARFLSREERQAASRDPKLAWDEETRTYQRVGKAHRGKALGAPESAEDRRPAPAHREALQVAHAPPAAGSTGNADPYPPHRKVRCPL